jgi:large repetitive protein
MTFSPHFRRGPRLSGTVVLAATVALVLALRGGEASAAHVSCGDTITADTTLTSDLVGCPNNGIVIGADDITLNLNGHRVAGNGELFKPCPKHEFCDVGLLNDGHDGVTVKHGSVREFAFGAFVARARHNRVLGISSSRNLLFGILVADSARTLVRDSSGDRNIPPEGDGMGVFRSHDLRIVDNTFRDNPLGLHVEDSTDNLIKRNLFSRNGIFLQADRNQVRRNRFVDRAGILVLPGSRNVIARNRVSRGISIEKGRANLVARNVVVDASQVGIILGFQDRSGGANNVVRGNLVKGSGDDGFRVNVMEDHCLLEGNIARGAGADGFDVDSAATTLTGNTASRNHDLGIKAVPGVTDGGGNSASGNGNPVQCANVFCGSG